MWAVHYVDGGCFGLAARVRRPAPVEATLCVCLSRWQASLAGLAHSGTLFHARPYRVGAGKLASAGAESAIAESTQIMIDRLALRRA